MRPRSCAAVVQLNLMHLDPFATFARAAAKATKLSSNLAPRRVGDVCSPRILSLHMVPACSARSLFKRPIPRQDACSSVPTPRPCSSARLPHPP